MNYPIKKIHGSFAEGANYSDKRLKIICVAYDRPIQLRILIDCFLVQTCPNWELSIIYDGEPPVWYVKLKNEYGKVIYYHNKKRRVHFYNSETRMENFGHVNRNAMLKELTGTKDDFLLMTNDDNYYVPVFVETFLNNCHDDVGFVYCNTLHSYPQWNYRVHHSKIKQCDIDMGCFIIRFDIAQEVGFNFMHHSADGMYAEQCKILCDRNELNVIKLDSVYFIHN